VSALAAFLHPTGYLITIVPNMYGLIGLLQKLVDPSVYRVHVQRRSSCNWTVPDGLYFSVTGRTIGPSRRRERHRR